MKKLLGILVLTATAALANADYSSSSEGYAYDSRGSSAYAYQDPANTNPYGRCQGGCNVRTGRYEPGPQSQYNIEPARPYGYQYVDRYQGQGGQAPQGFFQQREQGQLFQGQDERQQPGQQGPKGDQPTDQQTTKKIQDSLRGVFTKKYDNVNVNYNNGTVTLTGTVATQEDRRDLEEKVRNMDGIRGVNNQVTVQPKADAKGPEQQQRPAQGYGYQGRN